MFKRFFSIAILFSIFYFLASSVFPARAETTNATSSSASESLAQTNNSSATSTDPQQQRQYFENLLADLEKQAEEQQKTVDEYNKKGKNLKGEINSLNASIAKLNLQIKAVNVTLTKLNQDINETQRQINRTENKIDSRKEALKEAIKIINETDGKSTIEILLANKSFSDFFGDLNDIALVQENIHKTLTEIVQLRQDYIEQKQELSLKKEDAENLAAIRVSQKKDLANTQSEKTTLLKVTKGKESEYQKILEKTKETAAQIRSRIFELLGGGELTFEKAYDYAKLAEGATGVRSAVILAILHRESLLGKNTGRCSYNQKMPKGTTAMSPKEAPVFLSILSKLGIDPNSTVAKISCPNQDGTYGGAMGPAQFMPSTWKLFEASIMNITGSNPPNPWTSKDAFVATALYLKKIGADSKNAAQEKKAAAMYYCGSRWQRYSCSYYAGKVMETATQFQKDINTLNS